MFLQEISQKMVKPAKHLLGESRLLKEFFWFKGFKQECDEQYIER